MTGLTKQGAAQGADAVKGAGVGFAAGFGFLPKGLRFAYGEHRELAKYYIWPVIIAAVVIISGWVVFGRVADDLIELVWHEPGGEAWWGILHFLWVLVSKLVWVALALALAVVTMMLFSLIAAPFNDVLSERVEAILGTWKSQPLSLVAVIKDLFQTVRLELVRLGVKLVWLAPLFIVSLILPVVGQAVYIIFGGYLLAKYIGMDYLDWCMARRGWSWKQRFAFVNRHKWTVVGFGTAIVLSLMIPLGFALIWPGAVAGGTMLFSRLHALEND